MSTEKRILYLLRDGRGISENALAEILAVTLGENKKAILSEITEMTKNKTLKKNDDGLIKISSRGKRKLPRLSPKIKYEISFFRKSWTMIIFDIPESQKKLRDTLRYRLKAAGFRLMQGSLWVSPKNPSQTLIDFIETNKLSWYVKILKFSISREDEKEMVHRIWKLDKLNAAYLEFIEDAKKYFALVKNYKFGSKILKRKALDLLARETEKKYLDIVKDDPRLPAVLLPRDFLGKRAFRIYQQLNKYLIP